MVERPMHKKQERILEQQRRRAARERKEQLKWQIPLGLGLLVLLAAAVLVFTTGTKPKVANAGVIGPRFQVDTEKIDLGKQPLGKTVQASFNVKNTGDDTLTVNAAQTATVLQGC